MAKNPLTVKISFAELLGYSSMLAKKAINVTNTNMKVVTYIVRSIPFGLKLERKVPTMATAGTAMYMRLPGFGPEPMSPTARLAQTIRKAVANVKAAAIL